MSGLTNEEERDVIDVCLLLIRLWNKHRRFSLSLSRARFASLDLAIALQRVSRDKWKTCVSENVDFIENIKKEFIFHFCRQLTIVDRQAMETIQRSTLHQRLR